MGQKIIKTSPQRPLTRSRDGAVASHQCGLGSIPARCHIWVEFVVGPRFARRVFLRVLQFSSLRKNRNSNRKEDPREKPAQAYVASSLNTVVYFIYFI